MAFLFLVFFFLVSSNSFSLSFLTFTVKCRSEDWTVEWPHLSGESVLSADCATCQYSCCWSLMSSHLLAGPVLPWVSVAGTSLASWISLLLFLCVLTVQFSLLEVITASVLLFLLTRGARLSMHHGTRNSSSCRPMLSVWVWVCARVCACAYRTHASTCLSGLKWAWSKLVSILFPLIRDSLLLGQCCLDLVPVKIQNSK